MKRVQPAIIGDQFYGGFQLFVLLHIHGGTIEGVLKLVEKE